LEKSKNKINSNAQEKEKVENVIHQGPKYEKVSSFKEGEDLNRPKNNKDVLEAKEIEYNNNSDTCEDSLLNKSFEYNSIEEFMEDFNLFFSETLVDLVPNKDPEPLKQELLKILEKLFELQQIYYRDFDKIRTHYKKLKQLVAEYSEKFMTTNLNYRKNLEELEACKLKEFYEELKLKENYSMKNNIKIGLRDTDIIKRFFKEKYTNKKQKNMTISGIL